jgi:hypothetical protein
LLYLTALREAIPVLVEEGIPVLVEEGVLAEGPFGLH